MTIIFDNFEKTLFMVEGAYKKLKSHYFYDKTLLFIKYKIAAFESDRNNFNKVLNDISNNLITKNADYFYDLLSDISFKVLPKRLKSLRIPSNVVRSSVDHAKDIEKVNFFIDAPIQILILDFLWTLLLGKIVVDNKTDNKFSYASRFKKSVFHSNDKNLFSGIDFASNRCFEPYFKLYSKWRDNAFDTVKAKQAETDIVMMSLDMKSFYYSVEFNFASIPQLINNDPRYVEFDFLTNVIERIFLTYTNLICDYKKGINKQNNACVFPIGLISPVLLREIYLIKLDKSIISGIKPFYYGRYVDDILIVTDASDMNQFTDDDFKQKFMIESGITTPSGGNNLKFIVYPNLKLQKDKINFLFFEKSMKDNILLEIYNNQIRVNSSEANLLPDMELLNESFNDSAYIITNLDKSNKIRDLGFMEGNNYRATMFINGLIRLLKNTSSYDAKINIYIQEIMDFYGGSQSIECLNSWRSVFELFVLSNNKDMANRFFVNISDYIKKLTFENLDPDEVIKKKHIRVLKLLKDSLQEHLKISLTLATSLNYEMLKTKRGKLYEMAKIIRKANFLSHHLVAFPLLNYAVCANTHSSLIVGEISFYSIGKNICNASLELDDFRLKWSPRYINLNEFYIYSSLFFLNHHERNTTSYTTTIFNKFLSHNNLNGNFENPILKDEIESYNYGKSNIRFRKISVENAIIRDVKIGLVNTWLNYKSCVKCLKDPTAPLSLHNKQMLFQILNSAKKSKTDMLIFPEFYLPIAWLNDVSRFSKDNGITVVSGLQYIVYGDIAYNKVCIIEPSISKRKFKNSLVFLRDKNYYAPGEKIELSKNGLRCSDQTNPFYYIIGNSKVQFSTMLCFEFTDILSRASLKSNIDILFVPQFNKDTNYFSSIVESATRDLHCFVVQSNTSVYGDSRITAPFKTERKNLVQIKGGINDIVIVGEIKLKEFRKFQEKYNSRLYSAIKNCFNCSKIRNKNDEEERNKICRSCAKNFSKNHIKNIPPNFNR